MGQLIDRTGDRYGRLAVLYRDTSVGPATGGKRVRWMCKCDCGAVISKTGHELASGDTTSCGCLHREMVGDMRRSHAMTRTPTYRSWQAMKERCLNPKADNFKFYGGAGISVCERWKNSFEAFLEDMGRRPNGMTLDRIDPCENYEPGNCRWATPPEQSYTTSRLRFYNWRGKQMLVRQIAEMEGVPYTSLVKALRKNPNSKQAVAHVKARRGRSGIQNLRPAT